jgi:hypothetical protein
MITQRFRPVGWVAGVAAAATMLYMISLQVASERGRLEDVDRKIAAAKRDIRQLQTELGTRASLRQLERWNGEVLSLSAPGVGQFLRGEDALATLDRGSMKAGTAAPPPVMMAVMSAEAPSAPAPTLIARLTTPAAPPKPMTQADRTVQAAIAPRATARAKPQSVKAPEKVAMLDQKLLNTRTLGDIARAAESEAKKAKPKK